MNTARCMSAPVRVRIWAPTCLPARWTAARLICPWHGLRLTGGGEFGWKPYPSYDDGVLAWVRLDDVGGEPSTDMPVIPTRPDGATIARRDTAGRYMRAPRHHRQPDGPMARIMVSPLLVHSARGDQLPATGRRCSRGVRSLPRSGDVSDRQGGHTGSRRVHQSGATHDRDAHRRRRRLGQRSGNPCNSPGPGRRRSAPHGGARSRRRPLGPPGIRSCAARRAC